MNDFSNTNSLGYIRYYDLNLSRVLINYIYGWPGYGVVCPGRVTSNGSAAIIAQVIYGMHYDSMHELKDTDFFVECVIDGKRCESEGVESIQKRLIDTFNLRLEDFFQND